MAPSELPRPIANLRVRHPMCTVARIARSPQPPYLLWDNRLGEAPRYGTGCGAATARDQLSDGVAQVAQIPWDGPQVRIIEHQALAPGHTALLIEERGVLVARRHAF